MTITEEIRRWILKKNSFSFFLPGNETDGRPFDSNYESVVISDDGSKLILNIGFEVCIEIYGRISIDDEGCNLIFTNFEKLIFKRKGIQVDEYDGGEFCLTGF